jgi:hypothetical protein
VTPKCSAISSTESHRSSVMRIPTTVELSQSKSLITYQYRTESRNLRRSFSAAITNGDALDTILVGYYEGHDLMYGASVRAGIPLRLPRVLLSHFDELRTPRCPFANLPDRGEGRWGEGMTAAKMAACRWLDPFIVARIEFLEWTPDNRLRHPRFVGICSESNASDIVHE